MVNLHPSGRASYHVAPSSQIARSQPVANQTSQSSQSLADQIRNAFSQVLQQLGINASSFKLTVEPNSGQTSSSSGQNSGSSGAANAASQLGFSALAQTGPLAPQTDEGTLPQFQPQHWYGANAADDAYWSKQPAAVQQLREIDNLDQRKALATQLAGQGYQIDVPIMVWGWDASKTTALRQSAGYTWVPSALQNPVTAAPGITGPGITPYDPNNPPAGSIPV